MIIKLTFLTSLAASLRVSHAALADTKSYTGTGSVTFKRLSTAATGSNFTYKMTISTP